MNAKNANRTKRTHRHEEGSLEWLTAIGRSGKARIRRLSWGQLARIYRSAKATRATRGLIEREARRCGYRPATILGLNRWA